MIQHAPTQAARLHLESRLCVSHCYAHGNNVGRIVKALERNPEIFHYFAAYATAARYSGSRAVSDSRRRGQTLWHESRSRLHLRLPEQFLCSSGMPCIWARTEHWSHRARSPQCNGRSRHGQIDNSCQLHCAGDDHAEFPHPIEWHRVQAVIHRRRTSDDIVCRADVVQLGRRRTGSFICLSIHQLQRMGSRLTLRRRSHISFAPIVKSYPHFPIWLPCRWIVHQVFKPPIPIATKTRATLT